MNLSLQNIYELITYDINIKIEDKAKLIKSFKNSLPAKLFFNKNNLEDEEYINNLIDYMNNNKDENLLIFNKPINIGQKTFEKGELNFVVAALLYLKKIGNTDAHPNIDNDRNIELNDIKKKISNINKFLSLINNSNNLTLPSIDTNILINDSIKNEIKETLHKIADDILENFTEKLFNKNSKTIDILSYMFEGKADKIINNNSFFLRVVRQNIDNMIDKDSYENISDYVDQKSLKKCEMMSLELDKIINMIKSKTIEFANFKFEDNKFLDFLIKNECNSINIQQYSAFEEIINKYKDYLPNELSKIEKKSYILFKFTKICFESQNFLKQKKEMQSIISNFLKYNIIKKKLDDIFNLVENELTQDIKRIDNNKFIDNIKEFIKNKRFSNYNELSEINIDVTKIIEIIKELLQQENINWMKLSSEETLSLSTYLFYLQNN